MTSMSSSPRSAVGAPSSGRAARALRFCVRGVALHAIPALLAIVVLREFVPEGDRGAAGAWAALLSRSPVVAGAILFVVFSSILHYWRFWLPGGAYLSALPDAIVRAERDPRALRAWALVTDRARAICARGVRRALGPSSPTSARFEERLTAFGDAVRAVDLRSARDALAGLESLAAVPLRRQAVVRSIRVGVIALASIGVVLLARRRFVEPYQVLTGSMLPTLEPGDRIGGNKRAYDAAAGRLPARGDIIVFQSAAVPIGAGSWPEVLVKRAIALPGDRVEMSGAGDVLVNGWTVPSCAAGRYVYVLPDGQGDLVEGNVRVEFLGERAYLTLRSASSPATMRPYTVPPGEVFVLGDNRSNSVDSRSWNGGRGAGVPSAAIDARADWFLVGRHRSGDADFGRLFRQIASVQGEFRLEGVDARGVEEGIRRCLEQRPLVTAPPPPREWPRRTGA